MGRPSRLLFVCRECSRESSGPDLRKELKRRIREDGLKGQVRVVKTDCMGLCPDDGRVTVCQADGEALVAIGGRRDREALYEAAVEPLDDAS